MVLYDAECLPQATLGVDVLNDRETLAGEISTYLLQRFTAVVRGPPILHSNTARQQVLNCTPTAFMSNFFNLLRT